FPCKSIGCVVSTDAFARSLWPVRGRFLSRKVPVNSDFGTQLVTGRTKSLRDLSLNKAGPFARPGPLQSARPPVLVLPQPNRRWQWHSGTKSTRSLDAR